jgi:ribosome-binding protein aMBF1 (putative translation factor)
MSYIEVHQEWTYATYKQKTESLPLDENECNKTLDKTRHVIQITRIKKKIDIITLANMVGTTPASLSKYEKGEEILSKEVLEKLFKVLQISSKRN